MFKNYMHNELGITKEEIRDWVTEAVKQEAERLVANEFGKFDIKQYITEIIRDKKYYGSMHLNEDIRNSLVDRIMEHIKIVTNEK